MCRRVIVNFFRRDILVAAYINLRKRKDIPISVYTKGLNFSFAAPDPLTVNFVWRCHRQIIRSVDLGNNTPIVTALEVTYFFLAYMAISFSFHLSVFRLSIILLFTLFHLFILVPIKLPLSIARSISCLYSKMQSNQLCINSFSYICFSFFLCVRI